MKTKEKSFIEKKFEILSNSEGDYGEQGSLTLNVLIATCYSVDLRMSDGYQNLKSLN